MRPQLLLLALLGLACTHAKPAPPPPPRGLLGITAKVTLTVTPPPAPTK